MVGQRLLDGVKDDFYDLVHSLNSWRFYKSIAYTAVGLTLFSIGVNGILVPHKFISSGATGIALLIYFLLGTPSVGIIYSLLNVPILLLGWRAMSLKFVVLALIGVVLSGLTLQLTQNVRIPASDPLMAAIMAGILTGAGTGLYLRYGGSAGGMDIVAAVMRRKYGIPMGTTFISVNSINFVAAGIINHSIDIAFYTAVAMWVHSAMVERMQTGFSARRAALIVTGEPDKIAQLIIRRLNRGVTFLHGSGGMSHRETRVIYTVVNMIELARLKELIFDVDACAFIAVTEATEVIGYRFAGWADQGFERRTPPPPAHGQAAAAAAAAAAALTPPAAADTAAPAPPPPRHA